MGLKNYIANGPLTVILADARNAATSWLRHIRTTGRGGIDLVARIGTPIYAPTDGVMDQRPNDGSAGNSCRLWHKDNVGWADVFSHMSRYATGDMAQVKQGDVIGYSGDSGAPGQPHVHRHLLDPQGRRQNPWLYFNSSPASVGGSPVLPPQEGIDMPVVLSNTTTKHVYTIWPQGIRHETWLPAEGDARGARFTINVLSPEDKLIEAEEGAQFNAILDSFGVPRDKALAVVEANGGKGGGVWSQVDEARNDVRLLAEQVKALTKLVTALTPAKK